MRKFIKTTMLGGIFFALPFVVGILIFEKAVTLVRRLLDPIVGQLPMHVDHPWLIASIVIVAICFIAGLVPRTRLGKRANRKMEEAIFKKIPGYRMMRDLSDRFMGQTGDERFQTVLIESGDSQELGLLVEEHADGHCTVFLPSVPNPTAGSVKIVPRANVRLLDVSLNDTLRCLGAWGVGAKKLLKCLNGEENR